MEKIEKRNGISADLLKWIAIVTMFIDHVGAAVVEKTNLLYQTNGGIVYFTLRYIGRLAFPIFCFLLIEGFYYTRSRGKYLRNLLLFALISLSASAETEPQTSPYGLYETAATLNDSWGFSIHDNNWKSAEKIRANREHLKSLGINYLLNVGPDALGRIPAPAQDILREVGKLQAE